MKLTALIPNVEYDNGQYMFKNIFHKFILTEPIQEKYLQVYSISDGESLEDISYAVYGDPVYFWTIMIVNNLLDPIFDLPLAESAIQEMARDLSYVDGELDMNSYVSNYDILVSQNDQKRQINVIKREYLNKFLTEMIRSSENA